MAPIIGGTRLIHDGWARFLVAEVTMADGSRVKREMEDHGRAVAVLPYDPERRLAVLISQFRAPVLFAEGPPEVMEVPAGILDEGDPAEGARREAYEETGLRLGALEPVASAWSMPGISTERMDLFLAPYGQGDKAGPGGGLSEEHEAISVHELPLDAIARMSEDGTIADMKTLVLVYALRLRRPDLFAAR